MWSCVCPIPNVTACKLIKESAIMGLPSIIAYVPQFKYQMKIIWIRASALYEQLLSSAPYTTLCLICNCMIMLFVYLTIQQLFWPKIISLMFQPLKLFFRDFNYELTWFKI